MLAELLDMVYENYPAEPDWSAIKEKAFTAEKPLELIVDLCKAVYLYSEDESAFQTFLYAIGV